MLEVTTKFNTVHAYIVQSLVQVISPRKLTAAYFLLHRARWYYCCEI